MAGISTEFIAMAPWMFATIIMAGLIAKVCEMAPTQDKQAAENSDASTQYSEVASQRIDDDISSNAELTETSTTDAPKQATERVTPTAAQSEDGSTTDAPRQTIQPVIFITAEQPESGTTSPWQAVMTPAAQNEDDREIGSPRQTTEASPGTPRKLEP